LRSIIARDVHDVASHTMMAVIVQLRVAQKAQANSDHAVASARVSSALNAAIEALRNLRGLSHVVHANDATGNTTDIVELTKQIEIQAAYYDDIGVTHRGQGGIPEEVCLAVLRIAQQCLANAAYHAPGQRVSIELELDHQTLQFVASNERMSGTTSTVKSGGLGLIGMRHRAEMIGGTLESSVSNNQFVVRCSIPIAKAA
jgi:signal transduction histidine kinase